MKEKQPIQENIPGEDWAEATYRTGDTQPPKSRGGIIAFLLVLVIFLCGITTVLSLMNIRLLGELNALEATQAAPVAFSHGAAPERPEDAVPLPLGFAGQAVPDFWHNYNDLPEGIYVMEVNARHRSGASGLHPGDILTHVADTAISTPEELLTALAGYQPGDQVPVTVVRDQEHFTLNLILESE